MINECAGNLELIEKSALLEGAKIDFALKNLFKKGKDYKDLKKNVNEIIKANNLSKDELRSKGKGLMHICKRIIQVIEDIGIFVYTTGAAINTTSVIAFVVAGGAIPGITIIIGSIIEFVVGFIINKLIRFAADSLEFNTIKKDADDIVDSLRSQAKKSKDKNILINLIKKQINWKMLLRSILNNINIWI